MLISIHVWLGYMWARSIKYNTEARWCVNTKGSLVNWSDTPLRRDDKTDKRRTSSSKETLSTSSGLWLIDDQVEGLQLREAVVVVIDLLFIWLWFVTLQQSESDPVDPLCSDEIQTVHASSTYTYVVNTEDTSWNWGYYSLRNVK